MVHRGADERNAEGGRRALMKVVHFDRDVSLVVVEREHHIKLSGYGAIEYGIRRNRPAGPDPLRPGGRDRGRQCLDLFPAEEASLPEPVRYNARYLTEEYLGG